MPMTLTPRFWREGELERTADKTLAAGDYHFHFCYFSDMLNRMLKKVLSLQKDIKLSANSGRENVLSPGWCRTLGERAFYSPAFIYFK